MPEPADDGDAVDPHVVLVLTALLGAQAESVRCSVPRLRKRLELPSSQLTRILTMLAEAELVVLTEQPNQNTAVALTPAGVDVARELNGLSGDAVPAAGR